MSRSIGFLAGAFALAAAPGLGFAQTPQVGDVQRLTAITLSMTVGSTEKETKVAAYTPPPGWYVRSHSVDCTKKTGNSSYSVNTVPQDWTFVSEDKVKESYKGLIDLAGEVQNAGLKAQFVAEQDQLLTALHHVRSSHHALVVEATARGEGFLRNGGVLELTVTAELVYVGTDESL
ncbi:MAG TPA: hypothetical protein VMS17_24210, partial [Gemmataceae bacterium]|nr:hypothetical protein [Gemmataceae bacterium]